MLAVGVTIAIGVAVSVFVVNQDMLYARYLHMWLKFKCHTMSIKKDILYPNIYICTYTYTNRDNTLACLQWKKTTE